MKHNVFTRMVSMLLVLVLLVQLVPLQSFALTVQGEISTTVEEENPVRVLGEVESLRQADGKHFRLSDGSYIAVSYGQPVHIQDETGAWQDFDNRLSLDGETGQYRLNNGGSSIRYSHSLASGALFTASGEGSAVSLGLLDTAQALQLIAASTASPMAAGEAAQEASAPITYSNCPLSTVH